MRKTIINLKNSLVALFLIISFSVSAQLINATNTGDLGNHISGTGTEAIFVYGGAGFTLTANTTSTSDGGQAGITFDDFTWSIRNSAGGADGIAPGVPASATATVQGTSNSQLNVVGLAPGFYTFIAQGETAGAICLADPEEFTVFVLRPLTVTLAPDGTLDEEYCADDLPAANIITATAAYDAAVTWNTETNLTAQNPDLGDFELRYRWYKVANGTALDVNTATPFSTNTPSTTSTTDSYTFNTTNDAEVGSWNYYVAVDYTVKTSGPYTGVLGGGTPTIINVTPKPGKPTISITAN